MSYEVVFTMSRAASASEWESATKLVQVWLDACIATYPVLFTAADVRLDPESFVIELTGAEDLIVEREATTPIWSVRTSSADAARVLSGVLLCLQFACSAETFQLSGSKKGEWQHAATALTPIWGGSHAARVMAPRRHRADALVYVEHGDNAHQLREYFRTHLELDEITLPDRDFRDVLADA